MSKTGSIVRLQLNIHRERRRGYWPSEASGNLADMVKVPKPARYGNGETGTDGAHNRAYRSLLEAPPPRVSSLPLRADQQQARSLLARARRRTVVLELNLTRSWAGTNELRRDQPRAQVKTVRKIAAALKVDPSEIVEGVAEEAGDEA